MVMMKEMTVISPEKTSAVARLAPGEMERYFMDSFLSPVSVCFCKLESDIEVSFTGLKLSLAVM